ncbi:TetR/AcrR family transcriptional regulator [Caulobacter sp. LARHSG274]
MAMSSRIRVREDPAVRRAQIIDEGVRLIGQHGFNGFTLQALAGRCGLSNAGLLHYFGSKDELFLAFLGELERQDSEVLAPLVARAGGKADAASSRAVIAAFFRALSGRFLRRPELARFAIMLQCESIDPTHPAHDWFLDREALAHDMFVSLLTGLTPDPQSAARQLLAFTNGLAQQWLRSNRAFDLALEWDKAVMAVLPVLFENTPAEA